MICRRALCKFRHSSTLRGAPAKHHESQHDQLLPPRGEQQQHLLGSGSVVDKSELDHPACSRQKRGSDEGGGNENALLLDPPEKGNEIDVTGTQRFPIYGASTYQTWEITASSRRRDILLLCSGKEKERKYLWVTSPGTVGVRSERADKGKELLAPSSGLTSK